MNTDDLKAHVHQAVRRYPKASEDEVEAIVAALVSIIDELTAEVATVVADLLRRVEALEAKQ